MSGKTEFPSAARLQELREQGLVPYSSLATSCWAMAALLIFLRASDSTLTELPTRTRALVDAELSMADFLLPYAELALAAALLLLIVQYALGLLQVKFLFRFEELMPKLSRVPLFSGKSAVSLFWRALLAPLALLAFAFVAVVLVAVSAGWIVGLLVVQRDQLLAYVGQGWGQLVPAAAAILAIFGVLAWMLERIGFLYQHRMSRQELLAEQDRE
jgi:flagellar biosynthesis protein FlhB